MSEGHDRPADSTTGVECVKKRRTSEVLEQVQDTWVPDVSVLMPCRNAMPWLPDAVASCLQQEGLRLELIAVDDGSSDGSYEFLKECEELCKQLRSLADSHGGGSESEEEEGPSEAELPGGGDTGDTPESKGGGKLGWVAEHHTPLTAREVASKCLTDCRLRVFAVKATGPSGQGKALNLALRHAEAPLIGEMESDDLRPPDTFKSLSDALEDPDLDAVASQVELIGMARDGMRRYSEWQNAQQSEEEMARCRFVEIPAMRASALYRRDRIVELGGYRDLWEVDGAILDCACSKEHTEFLQNSRGSKGPSHAAAEYMALTGWWPVDSDFWMRFFAAGMKCIKIPRALYSWRQYPTQSTRTHNRCSIEQLRTCKIHFIACPGGPLHGKRCQVWSVGITLEAWGKELEAAGVQEVELVSWKPGRPLPNDVVIRTSEEDKDCGWVRVFVYGSDKARDKVRRFKGLNFDFHSDWFAA